MQQHTKRSFLFTGLFFLASILFTLLVQTVDVQPIGPEQSMVCLLYTSDAADE